MLVFMRMQLETGNVYHIYNRGNNKQRIFFTDSNYLFFLKKMRKYIFPHCSIMSYCLMPNHFHILVYVDERSVKPVGHKGTIIKTVLGEGIRMLLSSYTKAINIQEARTGSLFQQQTKAKPILTSIYSDGHRSMPYPEYCFHYIHQNPFKAQMVDKIEDWPYSSFSDYMGIRNGTLCDKAFTKKYLHLNDGTFYKDSYAIIEGL